MMLLLKVFDWLCSLIWFCLQFGRLVMFWNCRFYGCCSLASFVQVWGIWPCFFKLLCSMILQVFVTVWNWCTVLQACFGSQGFCDCCSFVLELQVFFWLGCLLTVMRAFWVFGLKLLQVCCFGSFRLVYLNCYMVLLVVVISGLNWSCYAGCGLFAVSGCWLGVCDLKLLQVFEYFGGFVLFLEIVMQVMVLVSRLESCVNCSQVLDCCETVCTGFYGFAVTQLWIWQFQAVGL